MADVPNFSLGGDRYDQGTYVGRLYRCFNVVDPRTLLISNKNLQECLDLLRKFETGRLPDGITDKQLWQARKIKEAIIHPDTGKKILMPFRMSGYVPFGTITVVGMMLPNPSLPQVIFWQWMNQSHNACVNYANRNATKETPTARFILSYVGAVTTAVGIAVGLSIGIKQSKSLTPKFRKDLQRFVAYPATCAANVCNVFMMRQNELREGIDIEDKNGTVVGTSKIAALKAVKDTALTRILLPAPVLIVPPIAMALLERIGEENSETAPVGMMMIVQPDNFVPATAEQDGVTVILRTTMIKYIGTRFLRSRPRWNLPVNAIVCTLSFGIALPFAIALFPQRSKINSDALEEEIRQQRSNETLYYNKGL